MKTLDATEALTNSLIGLLASWAVTYYLLPLFGLYPSKTAAIGVTAMYFGISTVRSYILRRIFRALS